MSAECIDNIDMHLNFGPISIGDLLNASFLFFNFCSAVVFWIHFRISMNLQATQSMKT